MHFSWNFLYTFWIITALHLISTYFTTYHIASHHVASPRLTLLHIASHNIASGHTSHRIRSHLASHPVTPCIASGHTSHRIASTRTVYLFRALSFDTNQPISPQQNKKSLDRQVDIDIQDVHYRPYFARPAFRWSTLAPRLDARTDETLDSGARFLRARSGIVVSC
jgi:hypothetical protein